ncbi:MAG: NUDIX domain-containing protein [Candidatus Kerfeldbacteria bacterium]
MPKQKIHKSFDPYRYCPKCTTALIFRKEEDELVQVCPKCTFHYWMNPKPVVSLLIKDRRGNILMLKRAHQPLKGYWVLPGGFIRYNETPEQAVIRETKEEIGQRPKITRIIGAYQIDNDPRGIHIDIIYEGRVSASAVLSKEHSGSRYFRPDRLPRHIAYKHRDAIRDSMKYHALMASRETVIRKRGSMIE